MFENADIHMLYKLRLEINERIQAIEAEALSTLGAGDAYPNFELKKGRKQRTVTDEEALVGACTYVGIPESDLYKKSFVGIPTMEKLLSAVEPETRDFILDTYVQVTYSKPTLVYKGEPNE